MGVGRYRTDARRPAVCLACGARMLEPHLRVGGEAGPDGLIPTTTNFGTALADIVRCAGCGHMQLERLPAAEDLTEEYGSAASEDYVGEEAGQRATARRLLERLEQHVEPGPLLDVGCWTGFLLAEARRRGWQPVGIEPSSFASEYARERLGLPVLTTDLFQADLPVGHFRAVVLADVIEHFPDPGAALRRIGTLLEPDGALLLVLPDAGSRLARLMGRRWWSVIPTHVQYFTRASLCALLARHGFRPLAVDTAPKTFTVRYYLERIGGYSPAAARALVTATESAGVAEQLWAPDFGDRMVVVADRA